MARICTEENMEETRLIGPPHHPRELDDDDDDDEDDEEALSLCDLPVNLSTREVDEFRSRVEESPRIGESHEASTKPELKDSDFRFHFSVGSSLRVGSDPAESADMSTADELFFKGRILPLRHSFSQEDGSTRDPTRFISRSESMDFRRVGSFAKGGSISRCSADTATAGREMKNNFLNYSQPSPQPQIRRTSSLTARVSTSRSQNSSIWDVLRLGLVRAPEIELQYLKLQTTAANAGNAKSSVSRNSSCSSTSTSCNSKKTTGESKTTKQRHGFVLSDRRRGFLFGDCKCSTAGAEAVIRKNGGSGGGEEDDKERRKKKTAKKKAEKVEMARKRTVEWMKELSNSNFIDHGRSLA
ncbi:PREDICTED: uncharacterized protein LOC104827519 [Tarenaya hassleriana]|uniref:uncharacterized protein LOC104827519 n=1 Tax=Tarenaya hassleriana TaxID=28532 RepID=UPI00053C51BD|nr:PREDICTED: uncharacterized protein LOC104827519 [Tarenaya hassleriana]